MIASTSRQGLQEVLKATSYRSISIPPRTLHYILSSTPKRAGGLPKDGRCLSTKAGKQPVKERYNFNTSLNFSEEPDPEHVNYRRVTAGDLVNRKEPPTKVKMLVRDFIDDSLYNPHYGYFAKNVSIFTPPSEGFEFGSFRDTAAFQEAVAERYEREYAGEGDGGIGRQVWHTPTELFKPHYAQALTKAIIASYKLNHFPYQDLIIYEIGAGNGSFMIDSLSYIRDHHPDVYEKTKYKIIEISGMLARGQKKRAKEHGFEGKVEVVNEDFFRWSGGSEDPCFVVALEVFDNFAHDMIRYDVSTLNPLQGVVSIDPSGDYHLLYEPITDPLIRRLLSYRRLLPPSPSTLPLLPTPLIHSPLLRSIYSSLPFAPNLTQPDWLPTKAVLFLERLREKLPAHRLLVADFSELPDAVEGRSGPVVQTRYGGSMVPCETFLVKQGYFDIFFPTDFGLLRDIYSLIMNSPSPHLNNQFFSSHPSPSPSHPPASSSSSSPSNTPSRTSQALSPPQSSSTPTPTTSIESGRGVKGFRRRQVNIYDQSEFLGLYAGQEGLQLTKTGDGENVMLGMYKNAKIMF